jgi:hypothetical protein
MHEKRERYVGPPRERVEGKPSARQRAFEHPVESFFAQGRPAIHVDRAAALTDDLAG